MPSRAAELIRDLALAPHPEGGHYRRLYTSTRTVTVAGRPRAAMSAIAFLLVDGQASQWHRVDADEAWHWREGAPLALHTFDADTGTLATRVLDAGATQALQVVPAGVWQCARVRGHHALVTCTVSPGFEWDGFELLDAAGSTAQALRRLGALPVADTHGQDG